MNKSAKLYNEALIELINALPQPIDSQVTLKEITKLIDTIELLRVQFDIHVTKLLMYAYPIWKHKMKEEDANVR